MDRAIVKYLSQTEYYLEVNNFSHINLGKPEINLQRSKKFLLVLDYHCSGSYFKLTPTHLFIPLHLHSTSFSQKE